MGFRVGTVIAVFVVFILPYPCAGATSSSLQAEPGTIAYARSFPDGYFVFLFNKSVSSDTSDLIGCLYVQEKDGSAGIRVTYNSPLQLSRGAEVDVVGFIQTASDGEREITAGESGINIIAYTGTALKPIGLTNRDLGGSALNEFTPSVNIPSEGCGLYNKGLLVRCWGEVTGVYPDEKCFYLDDGSHMDDGTSHAIGARVSWSKKALGDDTPLIVPPEKGWYVSAAGISGSEQPTPGKIIRVMHLRRQDDITIIDNTRGMVNFVSDNRSDYPYDQIPKYEKYEAAFEIKRTWTGEAWVNDPDNPGDYNPFNPRLTNIDDGLKFWKKKGIYIDAIITKPDGTQHRWPCFYDYSRGWKLRYAPTATGIWSYRIEVRYGTEVASSPIITFTCTDNINGKSRRGFLRVDPSDPRFFSFVNGEVFYPIGVRVWHESSGLADITSLTSNGGNWIRTFYASMMFEQWSEYPDYVNNFPEYKALQWDNFFDACREAGAYAIFLCNDWTRWKSVSTTISKSTEQNSATIRVDSATGAPSKGWLVVRGIDLVHYTSHDDGDFQGCTSHPAYTGGETVEATENPYIAEGAASGLADSFRSTSYAREVFKRKLRWLMARYGYSTNLAGFELMNECQRGAYAQAWHANNAEFICGDDKSVPTEWPLRSNDFDQLPHFVSGSKSSSDYRKSEIPWDHASIGITNYHDFARTVKQDQSPFDWTSLLSDAGSWEVLGSQLSAPWVDSAVWADRTASIHRKCGYMKPMSWTEYGLIYVSSTGNWSDWTTAYQCDKTGQHAKDWFWALTFNGVSGCHWHPKWWRGEYETPASPKWNILKPLSNFLSGVDLRGMVQESYYPTTAGSVLDCSNPLVGIYGFKGTNIAYLYAKNLSNTWYNAAGFRDNLAIEPVPQTADITIKGLASGTYKIERWSTTETDRAQQIKSVLTRTIIEGENLIFPVNWDESGNPISLGGPDPNVDYDWGYKIYRL